MTHVKWIENFAVVVVVIRQVAARQVVLQPIPPGLCSCSKRPYARLFNFNLAAASYSQTTALANIRPTPLDRTRQPQQRHNNEMARAVLPRRYRFVYAHVPVKGPVRQDTVNAASSYDTTDTAHLQQQAQQCRQASTLT